MTGAASTAHDLARLHALQLSLLRNGYRNCRKDGRGVLAYSTCSMSPLQNEAIVARFLAEVGSERVRLVDPLGEVDPRAAAASDAGQCERQLPRGGTRSPLLQFDDDAHFASLRARCVVSSVLPPCIMMHPSVSATSVQFIAKFAVLA